MHHFVIVSDFNASNLAGLLSRQENAGTLYAHCAPFGQVMQSLLDTHKTLWSGDVDGAIIWTTPHGISPGYATRLRYEESTIEEMVDEARAFGETLTRLPNTVRNIFVPTWSAFHPAFARRGFLDMDPVLGLSASLMKMNLALHEAVRVDSRVRLFDSARWAGLCGERAYDPRLWYAVKTPYSIDFFRYAARDFAAALRGIEGGARKLIVLDLDDTLWGGTVGDDGWQNLRLGGHDPVGEAYRDFQLALHALSRRGVLLGIVSKNDEQVALEAINSHPDMPLRADRFAGWRINWNDKAQNIVNLAEDLHLGLDGVVFIDDNPVERDRIRQALPAVLVPEWPANPAYYCSTLASLDCFDAPFVGTREDQDRTAMYVVERKRKRLRESALSLDDWLRSLDLLVRVECLDSANLPRAAQLLNKTNQMNLSTRRLSAGEFMEWAADPSHLVLVFKVTDKLGDYGLVGIGSLEIDRRGSFARVVDFLLSCRVMGRKVEETIFYVFETVARDAGAASLDVEYLPTEKNGPCLAFLENSGMMRPNDGGALFVSELAHLRPLPNCVRLAWKERPQFHDHTFDATIVRGNGEN